MSAKLNPAQARAVEHPGGPLLVLAGAGSGKTRVITQRIAGLVERGVPARAICALTFTNKAAAEMRERVGRVAAERGLGASVATALTVSTFHAFGLSLLTKERAALGGNFTIFDQGDAIAAVKDILRMLGSSKAYDAAAVLTRISNAKNAFLLAEQLPDDGVDEYDGIAKEVYPRYQSLLRQYRAFDFDDLVCEVARLLEGRTDVRERWQEKFLHVLVDEYQDTNHAQLEVLRLLVGRHKNLTVVGDDDQAIYGWRGADVRNILSFEEHFPGATVVKLEQNYRSRAPVLAVANAVIEKRVDSKYRKVLFTDRAGGDPVRVRVMPSPDEEARWVAREIRRGMREGGWKARDVAVLYRSNGQSQLVEEMLREQGIAHRVIGGQQFFERKDVKDVLAYLKLAINPHDEISLRRVINYPPRGIGETSLERLAQLAAARDWTLYQAVERVAALDGIPPGAQAGCAELEAVVKETKRQLAAEQAGADVVRSLCERVGLRAAIDHAAGNVKVSGKRWAHVEGLVQTFARRDARTSSGERRDRGFAAFLQALTLDMGPDESDGPADAVTLSTLHGAKGLEFDQVFLVGCEEGILPHTRALETRATDATPNDIEEERRLFYVGVTRARERLWLTRAKARAMRGKPIARTPSRFLAELPTELVDEQEVRGEAFENTSELHEQASALLAALSGIQGPR
jgi:DNA helicase-2/ATP-dependent DNA helicase PcrA